MGTHTDTQTHTHVHTYTHAHTQAHTHIHMCTHAHACTHIRTHAHTQAHIRTHIRTHTYMHTHIYNDTLSEPRMPYMNTSMIHFCLTVKVTATPFCMTLPCSLKGCVFVYSDLDFYMFWWMPFCFCLNPVPTERSHTMVKLLHSDLAPSFD